MKKWLLRILIAFCVSIGFILFALNVVSGTSETQKRGLEQAFSQIFKGSAHFQKLDSFNLIPKFSLQISGLEISGLTSAGSQDGALRADLLGIGFGSEDLFFKTRLIERFDIKNLVISEGVIFPLRLEIIQAGLVKSSVEGTAKFAFSGLYGEKDLKGEIDMKSPSAGSQKFGLDEENKFTMNVGAIQASGIYVPYQSVGGEIKKLSFFAATKAGQQNCQLPEGRVFSSREYFQEVMSDFTTVASPADLKDLCSKLSKAPKVVASPSPVTATEEKKN